MDRWTHCVDSYLILPTHPQVFTLYARTHLYMGFELLFILTTLYIARDCADCDYGALTW